MSANVVHRIWHTTDAGGGDIVEGVIISGRALLLEVSGENTSGADVYLQLFNLAAVPANAHALNMIIAPVRVGAGERFDIVFTEQDSVFVTSGLVVVASSTKYTKTSMLAACLDLTVRYKQ